MTEAAQPEPTQNATPQLVRRYRVRMRNPENHPGQEALWNATQKRIIIRAGRRGGKTTGSAMIAVKQLLAGRRVLYACPTIDQVQKFWKECKRMLDELITYGVYKKNETDHVIEPRLATTALDGARIRAKTAWNAETLRGDYADFLILDEWQSMDETAWTEVGAPMLIDKNGNVIFIYTPPSLGTRSASKASDPLHAAKLFKKYKNDPDWLCIHFASHANPHISEEGLREVSKNMTPLAYRQEILAEDTEEIPGALWTRQIIEDSRVKLDPRSGFLFGLPCNMRRIVVGVDPSGGNVTEIGIGVAGEGEDGHYYFFEDASMTANRPKEWATRAIRSYFAYSADRVIGERNYGGDMVEETLRNVDENVSYHDVNATRGKLVRAEPILALFQQKKAHLVGEFPQLEEELCSYTAEPGQKSPNRLDAMVWCFTELSGAGSLGLLDFFKSGAATRVEQKPIAKVAVATSLAPVATNDKTLECPDCHEVTLQQLVAGGQILCKHCGKQRWPGGGKNPNAPKPLGGRSITLQK